MKVLVVICTDFVPYGGLTTVVMNYYRALSKDKLRIDIASTNEAPKILYDELLINKSNYINLGKRKNIYTYTRNLFNLLKNNYDVIHVNGNSSTMILELLPAKIKRIPNRIAHVHTTKTQHPLINFLIKKLFMKSYTRAVAVSKKAGNWLYGSNYTVLNNAINVKKYMYSESARIKIRNQLGISKDTFVVGNIGKLNPPKNHVFLLNVFVYIKRLVPDSKMIIVGGGELKDKLNQLSKELGIEKDVIFTGMLDDASGHLQAFDFFVFPSKFEGLGLAIIEAQASGLKCVISDRIPEEAIVTDQVKVVALGETHKKWAEYIVKNKDYDRNKNSLNAAKQIKDHGYDIENEANKLLEIYMDKQ